MQTIKKIWWDIYMITILKRDSLWVPVILVLSLIGCWSELDLYAPSFPLMMSFYKTSESVIQLTLSLNFLGFFSASLLVGPLADALGRRPIILWGTLLFVIGSAACAWAPTIEFMLLGRFIQGMGMSAPVIVCQALITDIYEGTKRMKVLACINSAITIIIALAPIIGVYLTDNFGWRSNFFAIFFAAIFGLAFIWLLIPETHEPQKRTSFAKTNLIKNYAILLKSKDFLMPVLAMCFFLTPYFILIGIMPLLFMQQLGVSIQHYAFYQGSVVALVSALSLSIPLLMARFDISKLVGMSTWLSLGALFSAFVMSLFIPDNPKIIIIFMWIYIAGITIPPTFLFVSAMDKFPELRASASSMIQSIRMFTMAIGTALCGLLYNGTFMPVVFIMLIFILSASFITMLILRRRAMMTKALQHFPVI